MGVAFFVVCISLLYAQRVDVLNALNSARVVYWLTLLFYTFVPMISVQEMLSTNGFRVSIVVYGIILNEQYAFAATVVFYARIFGALYSCTPDEWTPLLMTTTLGLSIDMLELSMITCWVLPHLQQLLLADSLRAAEMSEASLREAQRLQAEKERFVSTMSHEIRTPLVCVMGFVDLLLNAPAGVTADERNQYLQMARTSCDLLLDLVNDILSFFKASEQTLETSRFPLHDVLKVCFMQESMQQQQQRGEVAFVWCVSPLLPLNVNGDLLRLKQILLNLISNALRHTNKGTVAVDMFPIMPSSSCTCGGVNGCTGRVHRIHMQVTDSGVGLKADVLEAVFQPFFQVKQGHQGGTGLGLALVRRLIERMNGRCWCESVPGVQTKFHCEFVIHDADGDDDTRRSNAWALSEGIEPTVYGSDIIRVPSVRHLAYSMWRCGMIRAKPAWLPHGWSATIASYDQAHPRSIYIDGRTSWCSCEESKQQQKQQPCELRTLVLDAADVCSVELIIVCDDDNGGGGSGGCYQRMKRMRFDGTTFVESPLPLSLTSNLGTTTAATTTTDNLDCDDDDDDECHVLLVEDNSFSRRTIVAMLKNIGVTHISTAENGAIAVDFVHRREWLCENKRRRRLLILMDLNMPVMAGDKAAKLIQEWRQAQEEVMDIRIVLLTADGLQLNHPSSSSSASSASSASSSSMNVPWCAVYTKPITLIKLREAINVPNT